MKKNKIAKIISVFLIIVVLVGTVGIISLYTDGFKEPYSDFYVEINNKRVDDNVGMYFAAGEEIKVMPKYSFAIFKNANDLKFNVKIIPNAEKDFQYFIDEEALFYSQINDLSKAFSLDKGDKYFTFVPIREIENVIALATDSVVSLDEKISSRDYYYKIIVTSNDEKINIVIPFRTICPAESIKLDKESITL